MNHLLPVVKIDGKNKVVSEPEWITQDEVIRTTSIRIPGKSIPAFETSRGVFIWWDMGVDDIPKLFCDRDKFVQVDRGSMVNKNYVTEIDQKLKLAILKDDDGKEIRAEIAGSRMEYIKECLRKWILPK